MNATHQKIIVVGISGTGKTRFARRLHDKTGIPLIHMDSIIWKENWTEAQEQDIVERLAELLPQKAWIVEGWIDVYSKNILQNCDIIFYLDFPGYLAAWGGLLRFLSYAGRKRPELAEGCVEKFSPCFLWTMLLRRERADIEKLLASIDPKKIHRLRSRRELKQFL